MMRMNDRRMLCKWAAATCCALAVRVGAAANPVVSVQRDGRGVTMKLQSGVLRLEVCDERTIHVVCGAGDRVPAKKEFVVNREWTPVPFEFREEAGKVTVRTARGGAEVNRDTGAVTFVDGGGKTLLAEPADGGRTLAATSGDGQPPMYRVQQTFASPADERLWGMAQCQDGIWNWRGMPIELRQLNTQTAFPVLVSSRGYGLLWDNASLTDFNPVDHEVSLTSSTDTAAATGPTATEQLPGAVGGRGGATAPGRGGRGAVAPRAGMFTTGEAGDYVFFVKDGDRRNDIGIEVDGKMVMRIQNQWVPYTTAGRASLPAHATVPVRIVGGGRTAKVFARPLGDTTSFRSQVAEGIDYYVFLGPQLDDVVAAYRHATGAAPLWPKWAYGFWQCRERYASSQQLLDTAAEFRRRQIPLDLIVQDWQYWGNHGWGAYEWDTSKYPDPAKLVQGLHEQNVKFMISVWSNPQGKVGTDMQAHHFNIAGTDWIDQYNPAARELRWKHMDDAFFKAGTDAWWQDATEPSDEGNVLAGKQTFLGAGDLYRNAYPLFANQTVYDGQRAADPEKRVVTLTRSAFPGQQRYATALWSGDINGNWETFRRQIPAGLHVCLAGLPYWTTDCGGFFRPRNQYQSEDYAELLTRWFQYSTFCPVQRIHGYQSETEFWKFPKAQETLIAYDKLRYRMLPYIYSVAWRVTHDGYTMMRALPMDFGGDEKVLDIDDQYMFGPAFLVNPVTQAKAASRSVYLPGGGENWTNFWTGEVVGGGRRVDAGAPREQIPLFVRAGSIIPLGPDLQYAGERPADPIELRVYPGADGTFTLYEDEGDSYRYEKGVCATIPITWNEASRTLRIGDRAGEFPGMLKERTFRIIWVRPGRGVGIGESRATDSEIHYAGKVIELKEPSL
jgi:alpha-D-xyloside xylohydrolase